MSDLFRQLKQRANVNARRIVDTCIDELPGYASVGASTREHTRMLDFAVFIRHRTVDLVTAQEPLNSDDLAVVSAIGAERGEKGLSRTVLRRILALHASATLREIHEAAEPTDLQDTMHLLAWLGPQGTAAQHAYTAGFLRGQNRFVPVIAQVRRLTELLLDGDGAATECASDLGLALPDHYRVVVARPSLHPTTDRYQPDAVLDHLWHHHRTPAAWNPPNELVALTPVVSDQSTLALVQDLVRILDTPCSVGTAIGPLSALSEAHALARRVSLVTPPASQPDHLYTAADVFFELGAAAIPDIDHWLRHLAHRLISGPALLSTLDAYYRSDLDRTRAAALLRIHRRTLDYRLKRVRELTGIDPHTIHGIRILSTLVARAMAGR